jgi:hypothetical protein
MQIKNRSLYNRKMFSKKEVIRELTEGQSVEEYRLFTAPNLI